MYSFAFSRVEIEISHGKKKFVKVHLLWSMGGGRWPLIEFSIEKATLELKLVETIKLRRNECKESIKILINSFVISTPCYMFVK